MHPIVGGVCLIVLPRRLGTMQVLPRLGLDLPSMQVALPLLSSLGYEKPASHQFCEEFGFQASSTTDILLPVSSCPVDWKEDWGRAMKRWII